MAIVNRQTITATAVLILTLVVAGGFYVWFSCIASAILLVAVMIGVFHEKKLTIIRNPFGIAVLVMGLFYLISCLWAVDRGMALFGFFKFLPFLLYLIYLEQREVDREQLIRLLPATGTVLTILTFVMSRFEVFDFVVVEERLSGTFQYPNTYAIFLLVCLVVALEEAGKKDRFMFLYAGVLLAGIYLTGSRTVYIITALALLAMVIFSGLKKIQKLILCVGGAGAVGAAVLILGGRFSEIDLTSSTFLGRLLYYKDGLEIIGDHPFGMGYHGYFFVEKQAQSGVYNILNIHNEVLQLILDIGLIPALFFFGVFIYYVVRAIRQKNRRNAVVLSAMFLHFLFDYDMQFLAVLFLMILFVDDRRGIVRGKISGLFVGLTSLAALLSLWGAVTLGISDYLYTKGKYEKACQVYNGNTMAKGYILTETTDPAELKKMAEEVIADNEEFYIGYLYLAGANLQQGNLTDYMRYSRIALEKAPYEYQTYVDYATVMIYMAQNFLNENDTDSAKICIGELDMITDKLDLLEETSDPLAWKINDKPMTELSEEYQGMIRKLKEQINE